MVLSPAAVVLGHGPGGHAGGVTALRALQKGIELYDRLVESGKLVEAWETDLSSIEVSTRTTDGKKEFVIKFNCTGIEVGSAYIFLSEKGEYVGSELAEK